jgi:hypothetical protein
VKDQGFHLRSRVFLAHRVPSVISNSVMNPAHSGVD